MNLARVVVVGSQLTPPVMDLLLFASLGASGANNFSHRRRLLNRAQRGAGGLGFPSHGAARPFHGQLLWVSSEPLPVANSCFASFLDRGGARWHSMRGALVPERRLLADLQN